MPPGRVRLTRRRGPPGRNDERRLPQGREGRRDQQLVFLADRPHSTLRRPGAARCAGCRPDAEALKAHLLTQLARFKVPREFVFVEDLPRTALGKVQHFKLKEIAGEHE